jgi:hypothetical protein
LPSAFFGVPGGINDGHCADNDVAVTRTTVVMIRAHGRFIWRTV